MVELLLFLIRNNNNVNIDYDKGSGFLITFNDNDINKKVFVTLNEKDFIEAVESPIIPSKVINDYIFENVVDKFNILKEE